MAICEVCDCSLRDPPFAIPTLVTTVRLDKFLHLSRLVKRRTMAHTLCDAGRVRINGTTAKPSASVKAGDVLTISQGDRRLVAKVLAVPERPHPARELVDVLARLSVDDLKGDQGP